MLCWGKQKMWCLDHENDTKFNNLEKCRIGHKFNINAKFRNQSFYNMELAN